MPTLVEDFFRNPTGNLGTVTVAAATLFTVTDPHVSADAPTTYSYALSLSSQGVASGLLLSRTSQTFTKGGAKEMKWNLQYGSIALMWRGGCIIRSRFLKEIKKNK